VNDSFSQTHAAESSAAFFMVNTSMQAIAWLAVVLTSAGLLPFSPNSAIVVGLLGVGGCLAMHLVRMERATTAQRKAITKLQSDLDRYLDECRREVSQDSERWSPP
jgi:Na+/phosphate symporter